jgi:hypothetical protein
VTDETLEVGLSFGGVAEKLAVPLDAITEFRDPSVQFALQFQTVPEAEEDATPGLAKKKTETSADTPKSKPRPPARPEPRTSVPGTPLAKPSAGAGTPDEKPPEPPADKPSGEVVRLDRFRKK